MHIFTCKFPCIISVSNKINNLGRKAMDNIYSMNESSDNGGRDSGESELYHKEFSDGFSITSKSLIIESSSSVSSLLWSNF